MLNTWVFFPLMHALLFFDSLSRSLVKSPHSSVFMSSFYLFLLNGFPHPFIVAAAKGGIIKNVNVLGRAPFYLRRLKLCYQSEYPPRCMIIFRALHYSFHFFPELLPCARLEQNAQVWPLQRLHNDTLIYSPHVSVTEVRQIEPMESFCGWFVSAFVNLNSILISSHLHYFLFPTLSWLNALSVKITEIPMSPFRSRELLQVYAIPLYI